MNTDLRKKQIEFLAKKIVESKTLLAFLILFSPLIISLIIMFNGDDIGIPERMNFSLAGIFYPYIQLVIWIYWTWYSANRLVAYNEIDSPAVQKYSKVINFSKTILIILICGLLINSIIPSFIEYPKIIEQIVMYLSYGLIIVQLYLFYAWIYGFWIVSKTINDVYEKKGEERNMSMILFFLMPFTFGIIHRKIRHGLDL